MTRKDYELIAKAVASAHDAATSQAEDFGVSLAAVTICRELKAANPRFDQSRFLLACTPDVTA
jgi:hypothetical protein